MDIGQVMILIVFTLLNSIMGLYLAVFVFSFIKYPNVREKVIESFENGDKIAHTQDAYKAVTLAFAVVFGWALLDMVFVWAFTGKDLLVIVGVLIVVFGGLIGVSFKQS